MKKRFVLRLLYFEDSHSMGLFWGVRNDHITRREIAMRDKPIGSVEFMAQALDTVQDFLIELEKHQICI